MAGLFFNPWGKESGCYYEVKTSSAFGTQIGYKEIIDQSLSDVIRDAWRKEESIIDSIYSTYKILVGHHQLFAIEDDFDDDLVTYKGVLDFLIIPLIARRMLNWAFLQNDVSPDFWTEFAINLTKIIGVTIAAVRVILGVVLTIALSPIVGFCWFFKPGLETEKHVATGNEEGNDLGIIYVR